MIRFLNCLITVIALGSATLATAETPAVKPSQEKDSVAPLKPDSLPGTRNVHTAGHVVLAGQPSQEALGELSRRGFKTVISLRRPGEERFDEAAVCEQLGMKFVRLPISNPNDLNEELLRSACTLLKAADEESGVILHCASANRVGAVWLAHRVKENGLSIEQARKEAKQVGLQTPELESKALEYLGE